MIAYRQCKRGLTLIELLISMTIIALLGSVATATLHSCLEAHRYGSSRSALYREGVLIMERMTSQVRNCTFLLIPNNSLRSRDILAFSGTVNDDNDYYFGDPLFPRVDEDCKKDMNDDGKPGIKGIDDDGDLSVDEDSDDNDDEGGSADNEDPLDGLDNDVDGNVDEDCDDDMNKDGEPGVKNMDDDGDGAIDEGDHNDDDEDGEKNEDCLNATLYYHFGGNELRERPAPYPAGSTAPAATTLSDRVSDFTVVYYPTGLRWDPIVVISLTLTSDWGESVTFTEVVYPRNITQRQGKKVR